LVWICLESKCVGGLHHVVTSVVEVTRCDSIWHNISTCVRSQHEVSLIHCRETMTEKWGERNTMSGGGPWDEIHHCLCVTNVFAEKPWLTTENYNVRFEMTSQQNAVIRWKTNQVVNMAWLVLWVINSQLVVDDVTLLWCTVVWLTMSDWSSLTETLQTPPPPYTSTFTRLSTATSQQVLEEPRRHSDVTKTDVTSHSAADKQLHHTTQSAAFTDHVTVSTVVITTVTQNSLTD